MFNSFSTALTGLTAAELGVNVVGNNLANLNTTGFKASTVSFSDLVAQSLGLGTSDNSVGLGTRATTAQNFTQGAIQTTSGPFDAAIQGDGFFLSQDISFRGGELHARFGKFSSGPERQRDHRQRSTRAGLDGSQRRAEHEWRGL